MLKTTVGREMLPKKDSDGRTALHLAVICPCGGSRVSSRILDTFEGTCLTNKQRPFL